LKSEKEKMCSGELYNSFTPELIQEREHAYALCTELNKMGKATPELRAAVLRKLLGACGANPWIESPFNCDYGYQIELGDHVFINFNCTILDCMKVKIGSRVLIGPNVQIYSATHPTDYKLRAQGLESAAPITIGSDVWIGGGVILCPGVSIGERSVIGAGSVVTRSIESDVVAVGNPCKVIKHLA
jgi:maltose O-acetyltransferase